MRLCGVVDRGLELIDEALRVNLAEDQGGDGGRELGGEGRRERAVDVQNGEVGVVGDLGELLGDHRGVGRGLVLHKEHGAGSESKLGDVVRIGEVLDELDDGGFLRRVVLLGSSQEGLNGGHKTAFALAAFIGRVDSDFAVVGKQNAVNSVVFLVEVGNPPGAVEVNGGVAGRGWQPTRGR